MAVEIENSDKNKGLAEALSELGLFVVEVQVQKGSIPHLKVSRYDLYSNRVTIDDSRTPNSNPNSSRACII